MKPRSITPVEDLRSRRIKRLRSVVSVSDLVEPARSFLTRLREFMSEDEEEFANLNLVTVRQSPVFRHTSAVDQRSVAAAEFAENPLAVDLKHLAVISAADVIGNHDAIGRGPANRGDLTSRQPKHVPPLQLVAQYQIRGIVGVGRDVPVRIRRHGAIRSPDNGQKSWRRNIFSRLAGVPGGARVPVSAHRFSQIKPAGFRLARNNRRRRRMMLDL